MRCCGGGILFMSLWALFILAIIIGVVLLIRALWTRPGEHRSEDSGHEPAGRPMDTLHERYARGEIDAEEFEERRRALGSRPSNRD